MLSPYSHKFNQNGVDLTNLYKLRNAHQDAREGVMRCPANLNTNKFAEHVRNKIGRNGGVLTSSLTHGCLDCTHKKRYRTDLISEGGVLDEDQEGGNIAGGAEGIEVRE